MPLLLTLVGAYHEFEGISRSQAQREAAITGLISEPGVGGIWLICIDGTVGGYIALCRGFSIEFNGYDAFIDEFFLSPGYRGQGIGKQILELIKAPARAMQINALHLEVARDNVHARRLYQGAGFEAREKYVLMSLDLDDA